MDKHPIMLELWRISQFYINSKLTLENLWKLCREADEKSEISSLALSYAYLLIDNLKQIKQYAAEIAEIAIDRAEAEIKKPD